MSVPPKAALDSEIIGFWIEESTHLGINPTSFSQIDTRMQIPDTLKNSTVTRVKVDVFNCDRIDKALRVIVQPYDPVLGYADSSSGAGIPLRYAVIASTRNSSAFRF